MPLQVALDERVVGSLGYRADVTRNVRLHIKGELELLKTAQSLDAWNIF